MQHGCHPIQQTCTCSSASLTSHAAEALCHTLTSPLIAYTHTISTLHTHIHPHSPLHTVTPHCARTRPCPIRASLRPWPEAQAEGPPSPRPRPSRRQLMIQLQRARPRHARERPTRASAVDASAESPPTLRGSRRLVQTAAGDLSAPRSLCRRLEGWPVCFGGRAAQLRSEPPNPRCLDEQTCGPHSKPPNPICQCAPPFSTSKSVIFG